MSYARRNCLVIRKSMPSRVLCIRDLARAVLHKGRILPLSTASIFHYFDLEPDALPLPDCKGAVTCREFEVRLLLMTTHIKEQQRCQNISSSQLLQEAAILTFAALFCTQPRLDLSVHFTKLIIYGRRLLRCLPYTRLDERPKSSQLWPKSSEERGLILSRCANTTI